MEDTKNPKHLYYTGDAEFNDRVKRTGVMRFSPMAGEMRQDDDGGYVEYHNYCAQTRTKASSVQAYSRTWAALTTLAAYVDEQLMNEIIIPAHPEYEEDFRVALRNSRSECE